MFSITLTISVLLAYALAASPTCQNIYSDSTRVIECQLGNVTGDEPVEYLELHCKKNLEIGLTFKVKVISSKNVTNGDNQVALCCGIQNVSSLQDVASQAMSYDPKYKGDRPDIDMSGDDEDNEFEDDDGEENKVEKFWSAGFTADIPAIAVHLHRTCLRIHAKVPSCTVELRLSPALLDTPMFHHKITTRAFWDFSDPPFASDKGWMKTFTSVNFKYDLRYLKTLDNTSVEELNILGNGESTAEVFLEPMPRLRTLRLQHGHLSTFHRDNCRGKPNLTEISFFDNLLTEVPPTGLSSCKELRTLEFTLQPTSNTDINGEELAKISKLEQLSLSQLNLNTTTDDFLPTIPSLTTLNLSQCGIDKFSVPRPFRIFPKLQILDLSHNNLEHVDDLFSERSELKVLDVSHNVLKSFSMKNQDMKILNLASNFLTNLSSIRSSRIEALILTENIIDTLENLSENNLTVDYLDLSEYSHLEWSDENVFKNKQVGKSNTWVSKLNLSNVFTDVLSDEMISSLHSLVQVDLQNAPVSCSNCSSSFVQWIISKRTTEILHLDTVMCNEIRDTPVQVYSKKCPAPGTNDISVVSINWVLLVFCFIFLRL